jgi:hypothetical protein
MALYTGTRIGADGKRYALEAEDIPEDSDSENRSVLPVFGVPASGEVPVWNSTKGRLEWGAGGGGADEERLDDIEAVNTAQDTAIDDLEATRVSSTTITSIVKLSQAAYDAIGAPVASTLYVIVG